MIQGIEGQHTQCHETLIRSQPYCTDHKPGQTIVLRFVFVFWSFWLLPKHIINIHLLNPGNFNSYSLRLLLWCSIIALYTFHFSGNAGKSPWNVKLSSKRTFAVIRKSSWSAKSLRAAAMRYIHWAKGQEISKAIFHETPLPKKQTKY